MTLEDAAYDLIVACNGDTSKASIDGVVGVFKSIINTIDNKWESHLVKETNDVLMYDKFRCEGCDRIVKVIRTRQNVEIEC